MRCGPFMIVFRINKKKRTSGRGTSSFLWNQGSGGLNIDENWDSIFICPLAVIYCFCISVLRKIGLERRIRGK